MYDLYWIRSLTGKEFEQEQLPAVFENQVISLPDTASFLPPSHSIADSRVGNVTVTCLAGLSVVGNIKQDSFAQAQCQAQIRRIFLEVISARQ